MQQLLVSFLSPEHFTKWDAEVAQGTEFCQKTAGSVHCASSTTALLSSRLPRRLPSSVDRYGLSNPKRKGGFRREPDVLLSL